MFALVQDNHVTAVAVNCCGSGYYLCDAVKLEQAKGELGISNSAITALPSQITEKQQALEWLQSRNPPYTVCEGGVRPHRHRTQAMVAPLAYFFIYSIPTYQGGDVDVALMVTERDPGRKFAVDHVMEQLLLNASEDKLTTSNYYTIKDAWILEARPRSYGTNRDATLVYDPKRVRTLQKRRATAAKRKADGKAPKKRKKKYLTANDFIRVYQELWRSFCTTKTMYEALSWSHSMVYISKATFRYNSLEQIIDKTLRLEKCLKKLFGKVPVNKALYDLCEELHERFFSHCKNISNKPDRQLRLFVNRVRKAGITKKGMIGGC